MVEIIGFLAGICVLISFVMKGERKIRLFNIVGCLLFVIYGWMIGAISVWVVNAIIILVHMYHLSKKTAVTD